MMDAGCSFCCWWWWWWWWWWWCAWYVRCVDPDQRWLKTDGGNNHFAIAWNGRIDSHVPWPVPEIKWTCQIRCISWKSNSKCALLLHFMMQVDFALVLHLYLDLTNFYTSWQHSRGCEQLENTWKWNMYKNSLNKVQTPWAFSIFKHFLHMIYTCFTIFPLLLFTLH